MTLTNCRMLAALTAMVMLGACSETEEPTVAAPPVAEKAAPEKAAPTKPAENIDPALYQQGAYQEMDDPRFADEPDKLRSMFGDSKDQGRVTFDATIKPKKGLDASPEALSVDSIDGGEVSVEVKID
ncbi:hypothetical protein HBA55_05920 [Pseudomaricurvus alkylphenolicus]|uniref:hypothetical protein n=1 Tax=Pseudomaricurvus alkylphenolicus TaxID=1306991 RepID=UPI001420F579|nr:hypothetical protein [Pseudomaricurvus alkylphenolicus]NIB39112.1 hypothetical protein [Pseudomaricurvus alkylphenolicus]